MGAYLQNMGITVYPTICWSDKKSLDWCFDGEPVGGCVAVSSVGTQMREEERQGFLYGFDAMMERLRPEVVLFNGKIPSECKGNIIRIEEFQKRLRRLDASDGRKIGK